MGKYSKGMRYGMLTCTGKSIKRSPRNGVNYYTYLICQCDCGNLREVNGPKLVKGNVYACEQCAKNRRKEQIGHIIENNKIFGKLTVLEPAESKRHNKASRLMYKCQCTCGRTRTVAGGALVLGKITRCAKCSIMSRPQSKNRQTPEQRLYYLAIIRRCANSKYENHLPFEVFKNLISQNCHYCNAEPEIKVYASGRKKQYKHIRANGIDRIDSSKDYEPNNCVPCCIKCNIAKNNYTVEDFLTHIEKIYNHSIKKMMSCTHSI